MWRALTISVACGKAFAAISHAHDHRIKATASAVSRLDRDAGAQDDALLSALKRARDYFAGEILAESGWASVLSALRTTSR
jgi:hypothetical protein